MQVVHFFDSDKKVILRNRTRLKSFLVSLLNKEGVNEPECLSYIFCSDNYLLDINRQFLQHDFYTDIITFNLSENTQKLHGEIYISVDRVKDNADSLGVSFENELHRVIFHGALHLCGYKDKSKSQKVLMRKKEDENLKIYLK